MELVPIIYTALLIVAALAVITIIISYVVFKIKHKRGLLDTPTIEKIVQPVAKVESSVKKAVQRITKPLLPPIEAAAKEEKARSEKKSRDNRNVSGTQRTKAEPTKQAEQSNRIEVVKKIKHGTDKKDEQVHPKQPRKVESQKDVNLKSLGDDVIDKYADDRDDDMFTLNTKKD